MAGQRRPLFIAVVALLSILAALCTGATSQAAPAPADKALRAQLVQDVESGIKAVGARWGWSGWYQDIHGVPGWSSIWDTVQLFEAYAGLEAAAPSTRHRNMLVWFGAKSEGYANPDLDHGLGGFSTGYASRGDQGTTWYDDNGWLGLAFFDAYQETHLARFLHDAESAFRFAYAAGWDPVHGGIWWNSKRTVKCAESVNTTALLAVLLYEAHAGTSYLTAAKRLIAWADANLVDQASGLYENHPGSHVTISYLESPMLSAFIRLCNGQHLYCSRVTPFTAAMLKAYGGALHQVPQYDAMYLRYAVDAYQLTGAPRVYDIAVRNAQQIEQNAVDQDGYYLRAWDGSMTSIAPGLISVNGAALEALAWTAVAIHT